MILIKNIHLYDPKDRGKRDVLIAGEKIVLIEDEVPAFSSSLTIIDGKEKYLVPGFIDNHVHITGGGGEASFKTRVPELPLSKLIEGGITTVVGLLGTDGYTRSVENLLAKAKALKEEGVSCYIHTGSYGYPSVSLTDSISKDIIFIDEVIGVKIALSDHRSSSITKEELARLASDARVAGMLSGKAGIVVLHMGDGKRGLEPIFELLDEGDIPIRTFRPTHVNRNPRLVEEALKFAQLGGLIDITCGESGELSTINTLKRAKSMGIDWENITLSSDGFGSYSDYDDLGRLIRIGVASVSTLYDEFKSLVLEKEFSLEESLELVTSNVAKALSLYPEKGTIQIGSCADLLILDPDLELNTVIARGRTMMREGKITVKGTYE